VTSDWRSLSREADLTFSTDGLLVQFADGRKQEVFVEDRQADALRVWSIAGRPARVGEAARDEDSIHAVAWARNRSSDLVGFKIDGRGRLIGEAWVPLAGLEADEWRVYVLAVARACDRTEYLLSGRDDV
jgi:hypothetical protein